MLIVTNMTYPTEKGQPEDQWTTAENLWTGWYGDGPEFTTDCPLACAAGVLETAALIHGGTTAEGVVYARYKEPGYWKKQREECIQWLKSSKSKTQATVPPAPSAIKRYGKHSSASEQTLFTESPVLNAAEA